VIGAVWSSHPFLKAGNFLLAFPGDRLLATIRPAVTIENWCGDASSLRRQFLDLPRRIISPTIRRNVKHLKMFFQKYQSFLMSVLIPLGPWGVFAIALLDASAFGIPMDPIVATFVYKDPARTLMYVLLGAAGSAVGSLVPYIIGYKGGEAFVVKKVGQARFERVHGLSEKYGDLALIIPGMMPPGFPFKLFVFSAGVLEMNWLHFMLAVFTGRVMRFSILAGLTIKFGPGIVQMTEALVKQHKNVALGILVGLIAIGVAIYVARKRRTHTETALV
jgi:membrane protein YqaA with SNARE-associated domain